MQKTRYSFDKKVSSQLKAFALVLMIMHHLWHRSYFALFEPISYGHLLLFYRNASAKFAWACSCLSLAMG